jgi:ribosome-associated protein
MEKLLAAAWEAALEKKAENPLMLNLVGLSDVADYFLICSGQTPVQVRAIADNIRDRLRNAGYPMPPKEGFQDGRWVLLDFGPFVAHIFHQPEREFYSLEDLWHDAKRIEM